MQYSIINLTELCLHESFRLDAEFYHPEAVRYETKILDKFHGTTIRVIGCQVVSGPFGSSLKSEAYLKQGVPFVRISDLRDFIISTDNLIFISEEDNARLSSSQLTIGDLILSKVGNTIGIVSKVTKKFGNCNISENNIGTRMPKEIGDEEKDFILVFLNSKPGQIQILRSISGNAQPKLNVADIELIKIPHVNGHFKNTISHCVCLSESLIEQASNSYHQAEAILLSELGLMGWQSKHVLNFIRKYRETEQAERIDAEYFQPKYDEIVKAIKYYKSGKDLLGNLVSVKKCVEVGSEEYRDEGIPFVRVSNLSPFEMTEEKYISEKLYSELAQHQPKQGEILISKDATPGMAYHLKDKPHKMIPSGGILRLKLKDNRVNEDYLSLVLNSLIVKEQVNRDVGGSVILHWRPDQVKQTLIPILSNEKQQQIQQKISQSFNLRKQSKYLLDCAKKAVEMAIEKDEKTAMKWIDENIV